MHRTIKSYVLRAGRVSNRQQLALEQWLKDYALFPSELVWNLTEEFGREAETIVEIGFGMGSSLLAMAKERPEVNFIGIEVHKAGIGSLVADLHDHALNNVRIAPFDATEVIETCLMDDVLAGVQIFFPDPWPKKRHHKRRLIQTDFIHRLVKKIKPGGFIHCATDWQDYAEHMLTVFMAEPSLRNQQAQGGFVPRPDTRPLTKFEQRGHKLGHKVWDLMFIRCQ
ncbi:tRNA (guanosine(46)-N7)-methyltransferase TrmB [Legionella oakridgensis]|uniref:tRNA (guanine-N(7)-)-methyltransferase n=2 Tax=Legionella oakridgensis TaxID=29423 RepID=W0BCF6_9GAMM|nr:tRNA (guanosine(46)-N7)-methyltransferase TrmB [Legionella oakridgensis]AHE66366.1 tRNA guanine-N7--methyltransferase [Legionella oakridgensis ATCC 33761 = DSM 21215]ETO93872.1 tRNA (guanine-N(7)-)-methyltransferase [Legionella oakridgensis RV-2-2007]KTD44007.1 tRNA (guanine-N(7)-)-methyltransferase [Legionella oakridgensis]STY19550.1 tRNA (m7G46) methyltransferase, SAM-dependent [Legionella longbeachae]